MRLKAATRPEPDQTKLQNPRSVVDRNKLGRIQVQDPHYFRNIFIIYLKTRIVIEYSPGKSTSTDRSEINNYILN